jgi:hypothetical protein
MERQRALESPILEGSIIPKICGVTLNEPDWEDGFTCRRRAGHDGMHVDEEFRGTDEHNRHYRLFTAWEWV